MKLAIFTGLVQLYVEYRAVCDSLFERLDVPKPLIQNDDDWQTNYAAILAFLDVPAP